MLCQRNQNNMELKLGITKYCLYVPYTLVMARAAVIIRKFYCNPVKSSKQTNSCLICKNTKSSSKMKSKTKFSIHLGMIGDYRSMAKRIYQFWVWTMLGSGTYHFLMVTRT
jgi:hypothetical protein